MANMNRKRKRDHDDKSSKASGKRAKAISARAAPTRKAGKAVRLNQLKWRSVAIPDRMDDYEGLFGLEEIEGVEVVKDADTGTLSFQAADGQELKETKGTYELVKDSLKSRDKSARSNEDGDEEDEWGGFEDFSPVGGLTADSEAKDNDESVVSEEDEVVSAAEEREELGDVSFSALQDEYDQSAGVDVSGWAELDLSQNSLSAISKLGFAQPTLIQKRSIPLILDGHDVVGKASTGSGKTLAFGIPILEHYLDNLPSLSKSKPDAKHPTALILAPTRELAHQISKHLTALCSGHAFEGPRIATITGGLSVQKQKRVFQTADIVIATPGRLWEVIESSSGIIDQLKMIRFLVVDEADRLLSEGHFREVEEILNALDRTTKEEDAVSDDGSESTKLDRQTLVFSATFAKGLQQKLSGKSRPAGDTLTQKQSMEYLLQKVNFREEMPKFIDVNPTQQMAMGLKEGLIECAGPEKDLYLYALLLLHPKTRTLVFTNSISAVRRITPLLQNLEQPAQALHSNMAQKARLRAIERFTASDSSILIATDVAARGLDIPGVQLVIHYHVPRAADMYIHRSGRTARAEQKGSSILICSPDEVQGVRRLIAKVHVKSQSTEGRAIRTLDIDRRIVAKLKLRATLAKQIADVQIAKEKGNARDNLFAQAAEDLGVEYDSEEFETGGGGGGRQGRGNKRKQKERADRMVSKQEMGAWKAELRALLKQRVNTGVSPRYIAGSGGVDIDALLRGEKGEFLGIVRPLDLLEGVD